ncbi:MAG: trypsin-like peptidase domain-containing protein [Rubrivivax sp.]|nr:trypsin-like peptidase domain-containing protein [Rubrivivax sp.]
MRRTWLLFSQAVTVAVALLFVLATLKPQWLPGTNGGTNGGASLLPLPTLSVAPPATVASGVPAPGYSLSAQRAAPAVVSIVASKAVRDNPHAQDPAFRFFFGERGPQNAPQTGLGSGVIVSPEGYLLTNHHVVAGADEIEVRLADGRQAAARLIGSDPETDLAVLKLDLPALPVVSLGDATALQVGDIVLAIGNPFNVGQTVTAGIVSALGRTRLGLSTYENFIQTDAAINPGNSGGALVDTQGHLVGINTAIFSRDGGSLGIGFAIPVDTARQVLDALVRDGEVARGWLGVEPRDLTAEFIDSFRLPINEGALITGVLQGGPASAGGLKPGDVVTRIGGSPVANTTQLLAAVAALKPKSTATVTVQRGRQTLELPVTVGQRPRARQS